MSIAHGLSSVLFFGNYKCGGPGQYPLLLLLRHIQTDFIPFPAIIMIE